jgi:hypothetical protein
MGVLLAFMFVWNMIGAVVLNSALSADTHLSHR